MKVTAAYTIKNILFKAPKDVKNAMMKELTYKKLIEFLDDPNTKVQEQALMIYRNLMFQTEDDI